MLHQVAQPPCSSVPSEPFQSADDAIINALSGLAVNTSRPNSLESVADQRLGMASGHSSPDYMGSTTQTPREARQLPLPHQQPHQQGPLNSASYINCDELTSRQKVIREIYLTEANYFEMLQILIRVYVQPLRLDARGINPTLAVSDVHALFSDVEAVVRISERALGDMKQLLDEGTLDDRIGSIFCELAPLFKLYTSYVNSHHRALEMHRMLLARPSYEAFCKRCKELPEANGYSLDSFLILPVQRVPRYELLLRELIKHTDREHPEFAVLNVALQKVSSVANTINDNLRNHEQRSAVLGVQAKFGNTVQLVTPTRWMVRDATMRKVCKRKAKRVYFCLFNDAIIYGTPATVATVASVVSAASSHRLSIGSSSGNGGGSARTSISQSKGSSNGSKQGAYRLHRLIELTDAEANACENSATGEPQFLVSSAQKSFKVIADSVKQRDQWVSDLKANITEARRVRSTRASKLFPTGMGSGAASTCAGSSGSANSLSAPLGQIGLARRSSKGSFNTSVRSECDCAPEHAPVKNSGAGVGNCTLCSTEFSFFLRRHQCRRCGIIVCDKCSPHRWRLRNKLKRICHKCFSGLTEQLPSWDQQGDISAFPTLDSSVLVGNRRGSMPALLSPSFLCEQAFPESECNGEAVDKGASNSESKSFTNNSGRSLSMDHYASASMLNTKAGFNTPADTEGGSAFGGDSESYTSSRQGSFLSMSDIAAEVLPLPDGWREAKDGEGKTYYFSTITQEVTWDRPFFRPPPLPPKKKDRKKQEKGAGGAQEKAPPLPPKPQALLAKLPDLTSQRPTLSLIAPVNREATTCASDSSIETLLASTGSVSSSSTFTSIGSSTVDVTASSTTESPTVDCAPQMKDSENQSALDNTTAPPVGRKYLAELALKRSIVPPPLPARRPLKL